MGYNAFLGEGEGGEVRERKEEIGSVVDSGGEARRQRLVLCVQCGMGAGLEFEV